MIKILTIQVEGCEDCPYCREVVWNGTAINIPRGSVCVLKDPSLGNSDIEDPLEVLENNGYPVWCPLISKGDEENDQGINTRN